MKKIILSVVISILFWSCLFDNKKEKEPEKSSSNSLPATTDSPISTTKPPDLDTITVH